MRALAIFALSVLALPLYRADAWSTMLYTDAQVVQRAELIVVAHVRDGSLTRITHGGGYQHRAILIISRVLKGQTEKHELPIIIHYGLLPVPAQYEAGLAMGHFVELDHMPPYGPNEPIRIWEDNPSEGYFRPSGDVRKDQIWLLHLHWQTGVRDDLSVATTDALGVWDPEDIQPLSKEQQLQQLAR